MFVRKKKNKSGSTSVQVIDKANGYRVVETIGSARDPAAINARASLSLWAERLSSTTMSALQRATQPAASIAFEPSLKDPQMNSEHGGNLLLTSLPGIIGRNRPFPYLLCSYPCHTNSIGNMASHT